MQHWIEAFTIEETAKCKTLPAMFCAGYAPSEPRAPGRMSHAGAALGATQQPPAHDTPH